MDTVSAVRRSEIMSRVRATDSSAEIAVRRLAHGLGYRYRLHQRDLPGCPDLVFSSRRKLIFVHGCFWHRHKGCSLTRMPKSNEQFWRSKLEGNAQRDKRNERFLRNAGWGVMTIWECQISNRDRLVTRIGRFLNA